MNKQQETDADLVEQIRSNVRPIRDGNHIFSVTPEDIIWRMGANWLDDIAAGHDIMSETVIPHLESEAILIFSKAWPHTGEVPDRFKDPEKWRAFWVCEAQYAERFSSTPGRFNAAQEAALNALLTASKLRAAMDANDPIAIAALSMLLICEAMAGGYSIKFDAAEESNEEMLANKRANYKKSIGAEAADHKIAREACIQAAGKMWNEDPTRRIGNVATELNKRLLNKFEKLPTLDQVPAADTIKGWLKAAAKEGKLTIPEAAQRRGRPPKAPI